MEKCFVPKPLIPYINQFKRRYRDCLMHLGKSPDTHLYELSMESFTFSKKGEDLYLIDNLIKFYNKLENDFMKNIFITEFLERGRHYPFWHYGLMETPMYRKCIAQVFRRCDEEFHLLEGSL